MVPFSDWQQRKENKTIDGADKEILAEAERLDVKAMGPLILSELLFNENIRDQIKKYKRHFLRVSLRQRVVNGRLALVYVDESELRIPSPLDGSNLTLVFIHVAVLP